jgi:riboflavin synthase
MFTGLIADLGSVTEFQQNGTGATLHIRSRLTDELAEGDSIAVNGVCLTATEVHDGVFRADAIPETLRSSSLGELRTGATVNLELALRAGDRLGGHIVQGHVDGTGVVRATREQGRARVLEVELEPRLRRHFVHKGSVAVDGVSLTVSRLREDGFEVALIPETLERTTLGRIAAGARVNIELDVLAKHVERLLQARA